MFQTTDAEKMEYALQREQIYTHTSAQSAPVLIVLQDQSPTAEKKKSSPSGKDTTTTEKKKEISPQESKKKTPPKGFVPSEKIKADKAVDFPADI
jgi:hypothetical protein